VNEAGFQVIESFYVDSIGFFAWLSIKFFGYRERLDVGGESSLIFYDKYIFPLSLFMDKLFFHKFFGKNIFLLCKKV
jgi:hypothetical protein